MLNLNYNIIECQRRTIAPVLVNDFNYFLLGGGGGGTAGDVSIGGNPGEGGDITTGSIAVNHLSTFTITIGNGGIGGASQGASGTNGGQSLLNLDSSLIAFASGGIANLSTPVPGGTQPGLSYDYFDWPEWGADGTKGGDFPAGGTGQGGGTGANNGFPWTSNPSPISINGLVNSGGGGGGSQYGTFPAGNGGSGIAVVSFLDPRNVYDYTGNWAYFYYLNNRKYFYYTSNGTFTFLGKKG